MSHFRNSLVIVPAGCFAALAPVGAADAAQDRRVTVVNNSSEPILRFGSTTPDGLMHEDYLKGRQLASGQTTVIDFTEDGPAPFPDPKAKKNGYCIYNIGASMPHDHAASFSGVNICTLTKFVVDERGSYLEFGGPGKGPVKPSLRKTTASYDEATTSPRSAWPTDSGCLMLDAGEPARIRKEKRVFHWEGTPCRAGEFITGEGTLMETHDLRVTSGRPGVGKDFYKGRLVDGVWDGPVAHSDKYSGQSEHRYTPYIMIMGCNEYSVEHRTCYPHTVGSVAPVVPR